jgi:hypothetical protein
MIRSFSTVAGTLLIVGAGACDRSTGSAGCGIDALTGPLAVKQSFAEGHSLLDLPSVAPATLAVRLVAGPAWHATVTSDSVGHWHVAARGSVDRAAQIGYGVAVIDFQDRTLGVLAFDGHTVRGAPDLGTLAIGDTTVPLLGVRIDPAAVQSTSCPLFPDSLR